MGFRTYLRKTGLTGTPILATPIKLAQTSTSYGKVRLVRVRATLGGIFASVAILGIGWQFGSAAASSFQAADTGNGTAHSAASPTSTPSPGAAPTSSPSATGSKSASTASGTYVGAVEQTRFGDVQVQVVVAGGTADRFRSVTKLHRSCDLKYSPPSQRKSTGSAVQHTQLTDTSALFSQRSIKPAYEPRI